MELAFSGRSLTCGLAGSIDGMRSLSLNRQAEDAAAELGVSQLGIESLTPDAVSFDDAWAAWSLEKSPRTAALLGAPEGERRQVWQLT